MSVGAASAIMRPRLQAVFLDRDGVLNRAVVRNGAPVPPRTFDEFEILDEARTACRLLKANGARLICVTNQPDLARGKADWAMVTAFNQVVSRVLGLDDILVCPHDDDDNCRCRKPRPGLLVAGAARHGLDLAACFMVGDRWRDIEAGRAAGCRTIFVDRGYSERKPQNADYVTASVAEAAAWIARIALPEDASRSSGGYLK